MTHDEIAELLGAYALDAVDDDERAEIDDHLRDCPRCREEVAQHRETAAHLAIAGEAAPAGLWASIAARLEAAEPEPDLARLYPLGERPAARRRMLWPLTAAAAAVVVLFGALGWQVRRQDDRIRQISAAAAESGIAGAARDALVDPRSTRVDLDSADGRIQIVAVLEPDGRGFLVPGAKGPLPPIASDRTYQLWGVTGDQRISLGLLGDRPGIVAFGASAPGLGAMAVTVERAGGVVQSTNTPVVIGYIHPAPTTA